MILNKVVDIRCNQVYNQILSSYKPIGEMGIWKI